MVTSTKASKYDWLCRTGEWSGRRTTSCPTRRTCAGRRIRPAWRRRPPACPSSRRRRPTRRPPPPRRRRRHRKRRPSATMHRPPLFKISASSTSRPTTGSLISKSKKENKPIKRQHMYFFAKSKLKVKVLGLMFCFKPCPRYLIARPGSSSIHGRVTRFATWNLVKLHGLLFRTLLQLLGFLPSACVRVCVCVCVCACVCACVCCYLIPTWPVTSHNPI